MQEGGRSERPKIVVCRPAMWMVVEEMGSGCGIDWEVEPLGGGWGWVGWEEGR